MIYKKYLSFTRKKVSSFIIPFFIISSIFITYQIWIFLQLSPENKKNTRLNMNLIRGTHEQQAMFYRMNLNKTFTCIHSSEEILYQKINDNYCDCLDGSDEPGTNACSNGIFYCSNQENLVKSINSMKVNDGICDCCDGSDEWDNNQIFQGFHGHGKSTPSPRLHKYHHPPCPHMC